MRYQQFLLNRPLRRRFFQYSQIIEHPPIVTDGLISWWDFNLGFNTLTLGDIYGNNNGAITNEVESEFWTAGQGRGTFDGLDSHVRCGSAAELDNLVQKTVEAWIHPTGWGQFGAGRIVQKANIVFNTWNFFIQNGTNDRLYYYHDFDTVAGQWVTGAVLNLNQTQHVAVTYDNSLVGNDPVFYLDGLSSGVTELVEPEGATTDDSAQSLWIGARQIGGSPDRVFDGRIGTVRIYNRILTPSEILQNFTVELPTMS